MPLRRQFGRGPWYRGGVHQAYVPASIFVSVGYAICLLFFGVFLLLSGTIMTATASSGPFKTIGPVALTLGIVFLLISVTLCVFIGYMARKQEKKRHEQSQQPLNSEAPVQPPPPSAYPHQQPPPVYPTAPTVPSQSPDQFHVDEKFPQQSQNQYPPQPAYYSQSTSPYTSPSGYQSPPPVYSESVPTYPVNTQPIIAGCEPMQEPAKQMP